MCKCNCEDCLHVKDIDSDNFGCKKSTSFKKSRKYIKTPIDCNMFDFKNERVQKRYVKAMEEERKSIDKFVDSIAQSRKIVLKKIRSRK